MPPSIIVIPPTLPEIGLGALAAPFVPYAVAGAVAALVGLALGWLGRRRWSTPPLKAAGTRSARSTPAHARLA